MLKIRDDILFGLTIGGLQYPLETNGFTSLKIVSTLDSYVPMMEIELVDGLQFFTRQITLADGLPMQIHLGVSESEKDVMFFRVHKFSEWKENGTATYRIIGYLDVPIFFLATANTPIYGTSNTVMKQLASQSGMTFAGDATSDTQAWLPHNERNCVWAQRVMQHAWAAESSLMKVGVTPLRELRFKDVNKFDLSDDLPAFVNTDHKAAKRIFQMVDNRSISRSGNNNLQGGGYGHRLVRQLVANEFQAEKDKVKYRKYSPFMEISKEVRGILEGAPGSPGVQNVQFAPLDCGNTHDKFWEAEYQNKRLTRLFSLGAKWMTEARTKVEILEPVQYMPSLPPGMTIAAAKEQAQGIYVVTAKTVKVQMGNYYEVFEGYTTGANKDPSQTNTQEK